MAHAKVKANLPVVASIRVASPCRASWSEMPGDRRSRFCGECKTQVFDLSELGREQAERLIIERNGDLCARYYQRADGTILTADCEVGAHDRRRNRVAAAGIAALLVGGGAVAGHELATSGPTIEALPEITGDADAVPIDLRGSETQHDQEAEAIKGIKDKLDGEQIDLVMGQITVIERDATLEQLKQQKQTLDKLRIETTK